MSRKVNYRIFEDALNYVRSLDLRSCADWKNYCKGQLPDIGEKPDDIPTCPDTVYKSKGWNNWGEWLGTFRTHPPVNRNFCSFEKARSFARSKNFNTFTEWRKYCKGELPGMECKPDDIPISPHAVYKNSGWKGWSDFLGTRIVANKDRVFRTFEEAREYVRKLKFNNIDDWYKYCRGDFKNLTPKPYDIPSNPNKTYKSKGWINWGDWLGTFRLAYWDIEYRKFDLARQFARNLNLKSIKEWRLYCRGKMPEKGTKPINIPTAPNFVYKDKGWTDWSDWLDTVIIAPINKTFLPFEEARKFVRGLNLKNKKDWKKYSKGELGEKPPRPYNIPSCPETIYKDKGWINLGDWLGTFSAKAQKKDFLPFEEAREKVQKLNLKSIKEWRAYCTGEIDVSLIKPQNIPASPNTIYKNDGWINWYDWLGKDEH